MESTAIQSTEEEADSVNIGAQDPQSVVAEKGSRLHQQQQRPPNSSVSGWE